MADEKQKGAGVREHLRLYGHTFLQQLAETDVVARRLDRLVSGLQELLELELQTPERCQAFWNGIKRALPGCPKPEDFSVYENILAYGFVHLADRYLRTWEVMNLLTRARALPAPRTLSVLDVGSGPAFALYAVADFYQELRDFAKAWDLDRLVIGVPDLNPVERDQGMQHLFHLLSEFSNRSGPFRAFLSDFREFKP
jgi:hypothetical protein